MAGKRADMVAFSSAGTANTGATGGNTDVRNAIYRHSGLDAAMLDAVAQGLCAGAEIAGISISGGETAQLKDLVKHFDLVGMAVGRVALDKVIDGRHVREGDVVIGVKSSGIHSNGLSLARKAFFADHGYGIGHKFDELAVTLGAGTLTPADLSFARRLGGL